MATIKIVSKENARRLFDEIVYGTTGTGHRRKTFAEARATDETIQGAKKYADQVIAAAQGMVLGGTVNASAGKLTSYNPKVLSGDWTADWPANAPLITDLSISDGLRPGVVILVTVAGTVNFYTDTEHSTTKAVDLEVGDTIMVVSTDGSTTSGMNLTEITIIQGNIDADYVKQVVNAAYVNGLLGKPVLAASGNNITVKVGTNTSAAFTVPYATNAGTATSATNAAQLGGIAAANYYNTENLTELTEAEIDAIIDGTAE